MAARFESIGAAKRYLRSIYWLEKRIDARLEECAAAREKAERITQSFSSSGGGHGDAGSKVENAVVRIADLQALMARDVERMCERKHEVLTIIDRMEDEREKTVLELRHIRLLQWEEIQHRMHYERMTVWRIYSSALRNFTTSANDGT